MGIRDARDFARETFEGAVGFSCRFCSLSAGP